MSPSRWGEIFMMLGMVLGVMGLPQPSSLTVSSSTTFARQRRQLENFGNEKLLCILKAISEGLDESFCNPTFLSSSSSATVVRKKRQLVNLIGDVALICLLNASDQGRDGSSCTSSDVESLSTTQHTPLGPNAEIKNKFPLPGANPDADPAPNCRCVPHWQCKDNQISEIAVEGEGLSSLVLDLRSNLACDGDPQKVCCVLVDFGARPPTVPPVDPLCGERNDLGVGSTILGFEDQQSQFGEFPWAAAIVTSRGFGSSDTPLYTAGGSLIHPQVVLTVAHSMLNYTADQLKVRLGEWNLAGKTEAVPHQEIHVKELLFHPDYHKEKQYYDVALLVLDQPAVVGATVNIICLPTNVQDYVSDDCVVSGWGKRDFDKKAKFQRVMKKVSLPVVDHAQCQTALQGTRLGPRFILHDSFLCAGGQKEGQDPCTGDGGSPLTCRLKSDSRRYVQVGVVAWGIGCGTLGVPGVYADVLKARPWIDQVINDHFSNAGAKNEKLDLRISTVS